MAAITVIYERHCLFFMTCFLYFTAPTAQGRSDSLVVLSSYCQRAVEGISTAAGRPGQWPAETAA